MQLLRDIKEYLVANGTAGSITLDAIGESPDTAMVLYLYDGRLFGGQIAGGEMSVQVVARAIKPAEAYDKALAAMNLLKVEDEIIQLTATRWAKLTVLGPPIKIKTDDSGRVYYGFNTDIITYVN